MKDFGKIDELSFLDERTVNNSCVGKTVSFFLQGHNCLGKVIGTEGDNALIEYSGNVYSTGTWFYVVERSAIT